ETSKSFVVLINDDSFVEGTETFNVTLSNPTGVNLSAPPTVTVYINDNLIEPATNVIDDPQNFVRQHYHDFLNRDADPSGLAFWTNSISRPSRTSLSSARDSVPRCRRRCRRRNL